MNLILACVYALNLKPALQQLESMLIIVKCVSTTKNSSDGVTAFHFSKKHA